MSNPTYHAWFSGQSASKHGYAIYKDLGDVRRMVTCVSKDPTYAKRKLTFPDLCYVGVVRDYISTFEGSDSGGLATEDKMIFSDGEDSDSEAT